MSLSDKTKTAKPNFHNSTLKKYQPTSIDINNDSFVNMIETLNPISQSVPIALSKPVSSIVPKYGCLKGGTLPTYRSYHNSTQKNYAPQTSSEVTAIETKLPDDFMKEAHKKSEIRQTLEKMKERPKKMKYPKQKRTVRRTFKLGKSKSKPQITVLISNKTIRNQITTKTHLLKQTPINEVRRYLTKKGFIRVGSDAPNDVLRKMYESAVLICGEIQNHNPDNLLYNFLNDIQP
jgi:hypothetical protein